MEIIDLLVLILATWRIVNMIVDDSEDGPYDILHYIRYLIGLRYNDGVSTFRLEPGTKLTFWENVHYQIYLALTCIWCGSLWIGTLVLAIWFIPNRIGFYLLVPFALSAGALVVKGLVKK